MEVSSCKLASQTDRTDFLPRGTADLGTLATLQHEGDCARRRPTLLSHNTPSHENAWNVSATTTMNVIDSSIPPPKIPDQLDEATLANTISVRLGGTPADGSAAPAQAPTKAIWVEQGDEVLIHLDSIR